MHSSLGCPSGRCVDRGLCESRDHVASSGSSVAYQCSLYVDSIILSNLSRQPRQPSESIVYAWVPACRIYLKTSWKSQSAPTKQNQLLCACCLPFLRGRLPSGFLRSLAARAWFPWSFALELANPGKRQLLRRLIFRSSLQAS